MKTVAVPELLHNFCEHMRPERSDRLNSRVYYSLS